MDTKPNRKMKILIVDSGSEGSIPLAVQEIINKQNLEVEFIDQHMADKLTSFRSTEVQQLLSVIPKTLAFNPPSPNRSQRRKLKRQKR